MKLTAKSEYALLALVYLARQKRDEYIPVSTIAEAQGIPNKFLEQILLTLKRARFVSSIKGQNGGFKLNKAADEITLADIIRLFDGALAPTESVSKYFYESTPVEREEKLMKVFKSIRNYISDLLEGTSLADIM